MIVAGGGGIGGLSAALGLAGKGCSVLVPEQASQFGAIAASHNSGNGRPARCVLAGNIGPGLERQAGA